MWDITDFREYKEALASSRRMRIDVSVLDQNEQELSSLSSYMEDDLEDGVIDFDSDADVDRSAQLQILDPEHKLHLDGSSPSRWGLWPDRFLRVVRYDEIPGVGWKRCPQFTGPLSYFERAGATVQLQALGKEALLIPPNSNWNPRKIERGETLDDAIQEILRAMGERRFDFPENVKRKVKKKVPVPRYADMWGIAQKIAQSGDYVLFYDGMGQAVMRKHRNDHVMTIGQTGGSAFIITEPSEIFEWESVINRVEMVGRKPKKGKRRKDETEAEYKRRKTPPRPRYVATASRAHPLSPWAMSRNGEPRFIVERFENDHLRTKKQCRQAAERILKKRLSIGYSVEFESLPIPPLELGDRVRVEVRPEEYVVISLEKFSLPLRADSTMSIGFHKSIRFKKPVGGKSNRKGKKGTR